MKRILFTILIIISLTGDSYSQRIPFAFWNRLDPDTLELDAPTLIAPADDTTGVDQSPLLDWDGVLYATNYIVQLDNDTNFSPVSWTDTTVNSKATVELGLVQGTTWYWRVLAFNIFDTSEWSVTYSFTVTTGPALTTPVLLTPANNATNVIQLPVLDWDTVINVRHYVVQLSDTISFTNIFWSDSLQQSTSTVGYVLDYAATYYWRVIAYNNFDTSQWSDTNSFTVQDPTIPAPTLITPANAASGQSQSPTLVWSTVDAADFYNVQLTQYSDFSSVLWNQNTFDTSRLVDMTLLEGTKWYWRARAINAVDTSNWSSTFAFIVTEGAATARTYYIDSTNGKDEYNGRSASTPYQTISKINTISLIAGDTVLFKGGNTFTGSFKQTLTHNDTTAPVTIGSYGTGRAKILLGANDSMGIKIEYTQHVKINISDIIIEGIYDPGTESGGSALQRGIFIYTYNLISPLSSNQISQVNINNCEIYNVRNSGIRVVSGDFGKTITCHIDSNLVYNGGGPGIDMSFNWHSNSRIYGNTVHDIYGFGANEYISGIEVNLCKDIAIERNLVYNIGDNTSWSGLGIISGASKNIRVRYNEIYNIVSNSHTDAEGIDFENASDSCLAEFNYIHDMPGTGILLSGNTSYLSITNNYKTYATERGSIDSGTCDYNVIRYNIIKNFGNASPSGFVGIAVFSGTDLPSGYPWGRNNQIYNNTIIHNTSNSSGKAAFYLVGHNDSTKIFNNLVVGDSISFFWSDTIANKRYAYINNNMYWSKYGVKSFLNATPFTLYTSAATWAAATGWDTTKWIYNPLLANPYNSTGDTLNNPYLIETLTKYLPSDGSLTRGMGKTLASYTRGAPTTDARGLPTTMDGLYGIGAYTDTLTTPYSFQALAKRWIGRHDTLQTAAQMKLKDSLILLMNQDTLLTKFDLFYCFANLDSGSAKINVLKDTFNITTTGAPTFTSQQGFTGNGTSSYLSTGWTPSSSGVNYTLDSSSMSIYSMSNISENKFIIGANNNLTNFLVLNPRTTIDQIDARINQDAQTVSSNANSRGLFTLTRSGDTSVKVWKMDTLLYRIQSASSSLPSVPLIILARNYNTVPGDFTTRQISFVSTGGKLSDNNQYRLTDNLDWYLMRTGTTGKLPLVIHPTSPANNDTGVSLTATLRWGKLNNASTYHVQVSYYTNFSSLVGEMTNIDTCAYHIGGDNGGALGSVTLLNNAIHYWRVRGVNAAGNGPWSSTYNFITPSTYDTSSIALFTRFPYASSFDRKNLIDSLIKQLKIDTIWSKLDLMYMYAAEDTSNAKINWKSPSYTSQLLGSTKPAFTAEQGFTGNGSTAYISTGWTPSTSGVNYVQDSASVFVYVRTAASEDKFVLGTGEIGGTKLIALNPKNTGNFTISRMNENGSGTLTSTSGTNSIGLYSMIRSSASSYKVYKNDTLLATSTNASTGLSAFPLFVLGRSAFGSLSDATTRQISIVMVGGKFSAYTQSVIHRRLEWYLNRIGAYVQLPSRVWLTTPANSATGVSISPDFDWDNVGANYYQIEIDDDIAFGSPFYSANAAGSEESGENVGELANNTTYYWRVRGVNTIGTGAWSSTYSFTTTP